MRKLSVLFFVGLVGSPAPARAHKSDCAHRHVVSGVRGSSTCSIGADCDDGICHEHGSFAKIQCDCLVVDGINVAALMTFAPDVAGVPEPGVARVYQPVIAEGNEIVIMVGDREIATLGAEESGLSGSFTLQYGSFDDPTNVSVTLESAALVCEPITVLGVSTGPVLLRLPSGSAGIDLEYNVETGLLEPAAPNGMMLEVDSQLAAGAPAKLSAVASVDPATGVLTMRMFAAIRVALPRPRNPERVSVGQPGRQGHRPSEQPSLSSDGRYMALTSASHNLVRDDRNEASDVFVVDRVTGGLWRVSVRSGGGESDGDSFSPSVSGDGSRIAFVSNATDLVPGDGNGVADVFVHDRQTGQTVGVTVGATGPSSDPVLSADGRYVAFVSQADDLVGDDTNGVADVFVYDLETGQTERVSVHSNGSESTANSLQPTISAGGRFVAFTGEGDDLVDADGNGAPDVFVHDRDTGQTRRVNVDANGGESAGFFSGTPSISANGRFVAFESDAEDLVPGPDGNGLADIFVKDMLTGAIERASVNDAGQGGEGDHLNPVLSADGRRVAFNSCSTNLVSAPTGDLRNVFLRDLDASETRLVSVRVDGIGGGNADSGIFSDGMAISADGNRVAFESDANDLTTGDENDEKDIFVRDLSAGQTHLASMSPLPAEGFDMSFDGAVSADGSIVAFASYANNLVPADGNFGRDVFVRDRAAGTTTRISVNALGIEGDDESDSPSVSADGMRIAFRSSAENLVDPDGNNRSDIFLLDRTIGVLSRVSVRTDGAPANGDSHSPAISADGQVVAFVSAASNLVDGDSNNLEDVFVHDLRTGETTRVSLGATGQANGLNASPALSADGSMVAFSSLASNLVDGDQNNDWDVFVRDRAGGLTQRVSVGLGAEANGPSRAPALSADGWQVAFESDASNLVAADGNSLTDVFVADRTSGVIERLSVATDGTEGDDMSFGADISANGRHVVFVSYAATLVAGDTNQVRDAFVVDRLTNRITRVNVNAFGGEANGEAIAVAIAADGTVVVFGSDADNLVPDDANRQADVFVRDVTAGRQPGDWDGDGDRDLADFLALQACFAGPGVPVSDACAVFDTDGDVDVDLSDLVTWQALATGAAGAGR